MSITLTLPEPLAARLQTEATMRRRSAQDLAVELLEQALPADLNQTLKELMDRVSAKPPNPACIRPATGSLADALRAGIEAEDEAPFDLTAWQRQWAAVEAEVKEVELANDKAEGHI